MTYPFAQQWTLIGRVKSGVDAYNDDVFTETRVAVPAVFAPGGSAEITNGGDTVTSQPTLYGIPAGTDVSAFDAVESPAGVRYEIDSDPAEYQPNPFSGWQVGTVLNLRKVTG